VTNTNTYGGLPEALAKMPEAIGLGLDIQHIFLGRYISFHDEVTIDDISRAMDRALRALPGNSDTLIQPFSCITHSTGGPIVRHWVDRNYLSKGLINMPLKHLVMLAPANHGSALAILGKARVGRIKSWFQGIEPGQKVLDWLCLGSEGQWLLNKHYLDYDYLGNEFYPFVLIGQGIDDKFYDFLNNYLVENGSDGVVRIAGANMNYRYFSLVQNTGKVIRKKPMTYELIPQGDVRTPPPVPIAVYNNYSHSGKKMGIMESIKPDTVDSDVVSDILKCLQVENVEEFQIRTDEFLRATAKQQAGNVKYCMLVFNVRDDQGNQLAVGDYDLYLLAGKKYSPEKLPNGFFKDRQMNNKSGRLVYYLDADKMNEIADGKFGLRIIARPAEGFSYYCAAEFHSDGVPARDVLAPNETTYVDVTLHRFVDKNIFSFDSANQKRINFKHRKPSKEFVS